ncbi:MAG: hypothetical protein CL812_12605 [Confluentimicrobium sp.]|nr:hypothetical protein [Actibacterium sp.]
MGGEVVGRAGQNGGIPIDPRDTGPYPGGGREFCPGGCIPGSARRQDVETDFLRSVGDREAQVCEWNPRDTIAVDCDFAEPAHVAEGCSKNPAASTDLGIELDDDSALAGEQAARSIRGEAARVEPDRCFLGRRYLEVLPIFEFQGLSVHGPGDPEVGIFCWNRSPERGR